MRSKICLLHIVAIVLSPPVFLTAGNKKTAAIFLWKITTAEFFCDESQFRWEYGTKPWNITFQHLNLKTLPLCFPRTYEITSKQVLWLAPYRLIRPHFYILPSQFPNDYLSITDIKTLVHTPTVIVEDSHLIPFPPSQSRTVEPCRWYWKNGFPAFKWKLKQSPMLPEKSLINW